MPTILYKVTLTRDERDRLTAMTTTGMDRFEFIHTPKHGSWLNMAEIELNVMIGQCLRRHIATLAEVTGELTAWQTSRNALKAVVNWQFTAEAARVKLKRFYTTLIV